MKIPKSFKLFSRDIRVVYDDEQMDKESAYGFCDHEEGEITLTKKHKYNILSDELITQTFYHEKVHMILFEMQENELSYNEKFVDIFAKLLRQSDETAKY